MVRLIRFWVLGLAVLASVFGVVAAAAGAIGWGWPAASCVLVAIGLADLRQSRHAVLRNYPIVGHLRFLLESIRPEIRQYFIESDTEKVPFSREQRALVYQRAKGQMDKRPFGTHLDPYGEGYEWIHHSVSPTAIASRDFRTLIGPSRERPYSASIFNISAMSFGSLSANAIVALNRGAREGGFAHDTGEGSISRYHREPGGDLIWEIGSGYFGARRPDGSFCPERFSENARSEQVRMIELKLSQGAKPGHGGVLPAPKVTPEIAAARGVPAWQTVESPARHSAFDTPLEMLAFIARMRALSGGKPSGFKLAIGHPWEWFAIVKAMIESGERPDFIVIDGKEGGTGAAPAEFIDRAGMPMIDALLLVHNTLVACGLRDSIRLGAAGRIITAFDIARSMALGADWCNAARGFMFALGCIQSLNCHTDRCPTGVATQDPLRQRALVVPDKAERVRQFHQNTLEGLRELLQAVGLQHPAQLRPHHIMRRLSGSESRPLSEVYRFLPEGALLQAGGPARCGSVFETWWDRARPDSFHPAPIH